MEPFFIRCETCHARLRVRDERFLGQVQSCPKCGSMVLIAAPAVVDEATQAVAASTSASPTFAGQFVGAIERHPAMWAASGVTVLAVGGLVAMLALGGNGEVAAVSQSPPSASVVVDEPNTVVEEEPAPALAPSAAESSAEETPPVASASPPQRELIAPPVVALPPIVVADTPPQEPKPARTMTLEPVANEPEFSAANTASEEMPDYSATVEADTGVEDAKSLSVNVPARVTNVADQLALPIGSIDLPPMPIGEFVNLVSDMAAVPIRLDPKVLGDAGLSSRSKVTARADGVTLGVLFERVLKEHNLAFEERDGKLVIVKSHRN